MPNRTDFASDKTTRKKGAASLKKSPLPEDNEAYSDARAVTRRKKLSTSFLHSTLRENSLVAPSNKISSSLDKKSKEKCSKEVKTLYEEAIENARVKQLKNGSSKYEKSSRNQEQYQSLSKTRKNIYAKNLKNFLTPGEINHTNRGTRHSGGGPVYLERDFASVVKNFSDSSKNCPNLSRLYSAESLRAFSNALSMLTNEHTESNEKSLNSLAQKNKLKFDGMNKNVNRSIEQICPSNLRATKSKRQTDFYKNVDREKSGMEVIRPKKFDVKSETLSLSSSNSDDYLKDLKLNELNELNEDELRELYENSLTNLTKTSERNYSFNPDHEEKENVGSEWHNPKEHSKICPKPQNSNVSQKISVMSTKDCNKHSLPCNCLASRHFDNKRYGKPRDDAELGLEAGVVTSKHFKRKSFEIKSKNLCQKTPEMEALMNFEHSAKSSVKTLERNSENPYCQGLGTEMTGRRCVDRERREPDMTRLKHFNQKGTERGEVRRSHRKPPAEELMSGVNLSNKSSIHFCQMIAKTLPDAKIIPFDKLSEIMPETELAKINEKLDKNMEEKPFIPGLLEDTQSHIDRIKQQVLKKAKECLPNATFSKINQFLLSNKSEDYLESANKKLEVAHSTPSLIRKPKQKISYQELKSVSSQRQKRSGRSSAASYHGGDGTRWHKYGQKSLTRSNSYYDHLYSVYGDSKQRQRHVKSRRKYASENRLGAKTNQPKSLKTLKRNAMKENFSPRYDRKPSHGVSTEDFLKVCCNCNENVVSGICTFDSYNHNRSLVSCTSINRLSNHFSDCNCKSGCDGAGQYVMEVHQTSSRYSCDCDYVYKNSLVGNHNIEKCGFDHEYNFSLENFGVEDHKKLDCEDANICTVSGYHNSHCASVTSECNISSSIRHFPFDRTPHGSVKANKERENLGDPRFNCDQKFGANHDLSSNNHYKICPEGGDCRFNENCSNCMTELELNRNLVIKCKHSCNYDAPSHRKLNKSSKIYNHNNSYQAAGDGFGMSFYDQNSDLAPKNKSLTSYHIPRNSSNRLISQNSIKAEHSNNDSDSVSFQSSCDNFDLSEHNQEHLNQAHENEKLDSQDRSSEFHYAKCQSNQFEPYNLITSTQKKVDGFDREHEPMNFNDDFKKGCVDSDHCHSPNQNFQVDRNISSWHMNCYASESEYPVELQRLFLPKNSDLDQFNGLQDQYELWQGLYEPTETEPDALNAHYYSQLASKLLSPGLFRSMVMKKPQVKINHETASENRCFFIVNKTTSSDEIPLQKLKPNLDNSSHCFKRKKKYFISFCKLRMQRNFKSRHKYLFNCFTPEIDHGIDVQKTGSFEAWSLNSNVSLKNNLRSKQRVRRYGISKNRGEQICVFRNSKKSAALEFLRFKENYRKQNVTLNKVASSQIKSALEEQSGSSFMEQKSHLEWFTHPNILLRVPEVTPLCSTPGFFNSAKPLEKITNSLQKVLSSEKSTFEILCKTLTDSSTQSLQKHLFRETNAGFLHVKDDVCSKTVWQLCKSQEFGSNFCLAPNYLYFRCSKMRKLNSDFMLLIILLFQPPHSQNDVMFTKIQNVSSPLNMCHLELKSILKLHSTAIFLEIFKPNKLQVILDHHLNGNVSKILKLNHEITSEDKQNLKKLKKNTEAEVSRNQSSSEYELNTIFYIEADNFQEDESVFSSPGETFKLGNQQFRFPNQEPNDKMCFERIECNNNESVPFSHSSTSFCKVSTSYDLTNQSKSHCSPKSTLISGLVSPAVYEAKSKQVTAVHQHFLSKLPNVFPVKNYSNITTNEYSRLDTIIAAVDSYDKPVLCSLKPKGHDLLETKVSFFYLLCFLAKWRFQYYSQRRVKYKDCLASSGRNDRKNTDLVNRVTQTDLSLTNSDLFDAFLLTRILSLDDDTENF